MCSLYENKLFPRVWKGKQYYTITILTIFTEGFLNWLDKKYKMHSTSWRASTENFKIKSRLQLQYMYFSVEALFDTLNHQQEALTDSTG